MKKEIEISNPEKILPWMNAPFGTAWILVAAILIMGFTPYLLFVNYFIEAALLFLFVVSCVKKYKGYKAEPNLKITKHFWIESGIHALFIIGAVVQSALHVWVRMGDTGLIYRHEFFFISLMIYISHVVYFCFDYYLSEKAAIYRYCKRIKKEKAASDPFGE